MIILDVIRGALRNPKRPEPKGVGVRADFPFVRSAKRRCQIEQNWAEPKSRQDQSGREARFGIAKCFVSMGFVRHSPRRNAMSMAQTAISIALCMKFPCVLAITVRKS